MQFDRRISFITFLIGVVSLMYELVQVRMLAFFLGNSMHILAIPIALLGLAIGSMFRHYLWKGSSDVLIDRLCQAVFPVMLLSYLVLFGIANAFFSDVHIAVSTPPREATRVVVYSLVFLPPYVVFGALFSTLFSEFSDRIGRLYFFDLAGAALGCLLTPLMLTWFGLAPAIAFSLLGAAGLFAMAGRSTQAQRGGVAVGWLVTAALAVGGVLFVEQPDPKLLSRSVLKNFWDNGVTEVDARWNELARTALMRAEPVKGKHGAIWAVVQDNGLSNVRVRSFDPNYREDALDRYFHYSMPWRLGIEPEKVLVMFAGMGRDMLGFNEIMKGEAEIIRGVEINRTVVAWSKDPHPQLGWTNLKAFHALPHIDLRNEEGRDFLNTDDTIYDAIYVANNGAVQASRTGHTRKFLDTYEAMESYFDQLNPEGVIQFTAQPVVDKIPALRLIFEEKGYPPLEDCIYVFGPGPATLDTMIVKPSGLTPENIRALDEHVLGRGADKVFYKPGTARGLPRVTRLLTEPVASLPLVTDDRPFTSRIEWEAFSILPDPERYLDAGYVSGWVKVFTVIVFAGVSIGVAILAAVLGTREQRVPAVWVGYLLLTGVGYMCVQIPLIAKTELFIGNPLYAVSLNLATFLVFNSIGSYLQDEYRFMRGPLHLAIGVVLAVGWGIALATFAATSLLSVPLLVKGLGVAVIVFPAGVVLGTFYPYCVSKLVAGDQGTAIPMTYGLTTLSSVLGSAFAMAAIINLGFTTVMALGVVLYVLAVGVSLAYRK
jgi:hypothetical protein